MDVATEPSGDPSDAASPIGKSARSKLIAFAVFAAVCVVALVLFREQLSLKNLAGHETTLARYRDEHLFLAYGLAFAIYVAVTALSLPAAAGMSLLIGWFFGFVPALVLVSFASTLGATIAFLISRYLLRDTVQAQFGQWLARFNAMLEREGAFYLFTLRLIPAVPFFAINVVMGLTPIRAMTFWWVSQLGMLPATAVYVYAGDQVPTLAQLAERGAGSVLNARMIIALALLGVFPLVVKKAMAYWRSTSVE